VPGYFPRLAETVALLSFANSSTPLSVTVSYSKVMNGTQLAEFLRKK
jgi:hypothetical protein